MQILLFYHLLISIFFSLYIIDVGGDALAYWSLSTNVMPMPSDQWNDYFGLSTSFIQWLNFIPAKVLGFSFLTGNILYGLLGFIGIRMLFILYYEHFIKYVELRHQVLLLPIFYLPNLHFWTSGIGKETVTLFALTWVLYGLEYEHRTKLQAILAGGLLFMVRPHIGWLSVGIILFISSFAPAFPLKMKIAIIFGLGGLMALLYPLLVQYLNVSDLSYSSLKDLMEYQIDFLQHESVGSSVDVANYNQLERMLTYLFRPLFYDAYNWQTYFASMENLIYIGFFLMFLKYWNIEVIKQMPFFLKVGLLFFMLNSIIFANSLSNLGIMMRMKSFSFIFLIMAASFMVVKKAFINVRNIV